MPPKAPTLYLIDGHALLYRQYHAIRPGSMLAADRKTPTNAVFGFGNTLRSLRSRFKPDLMAAVFDPHGEVKRTDQYNDYAKVLGPAFSGYKSHRDVMPDDLRPQIDLAFELCTGYGIPTFQVDGYEADDVLGTLAAHASSKGTHVIIVTGDKDLLQLVTDTVHVYDPMKDITFDPDTVYELKGLKPSQIPDWLGFQGDSADNIPGVTGVGDQTAVKLLAEHGTMEGALDFVAKKFAPQADEIRAFIAAHEAESSKPKEERKPVKPPKGVKVVDAYLFVQQDRARACRELATLQTNIPFAYDLEAMRLGTPQAEKLVPFCRRMAINQFLRDIDPVALKKYETEVENAPAPAPVDLFSESVAGITAQTTGDAAALAATPAPKAEPGPVKYAIVTDKEKLAAFISELKKQTRFAVDTSTTPHLPLQATLIGVSISWKAGEATYIPVRGPLDSQTLSEGEVLEALRSTLQNPAISKVGHNIKFDLQVFRSHGVELNGIVFDTMIAGWALDPGAPRRSLEELAYHYLGYKKTDTSELLGKGKKQITMDLVPVEDVGRLACMDADYTWQLSEKLGPLIKDAGLEPLIADLEMPLIPVLADMEATGIKVDADLLAKMSRDLERQLTEQEAEIYALAGENFNIGSPSQLGAILFGKLGLSSKTKTSTGKDSTSEEVLTLLAKEHELPRRVLEFRGLLKLKNTYVDALPKMISSKTGRIHCTFRQEGTETGRIASQDPNLQNIPIRSELGRTIRAAFKPGQPGWKILGADYSQIELRILAHYSLDETLLRAFESGTDIHTAVAARLYKVAEADVSREQRSRAKTVNFGILYGQSAFGLAQVLSIPRREAQTIIDAYFDNHPGVGKCIEQIVEKAKEQGFVTTVLGRRRFIPQLRASDRGAKMLGERLAVNTIFQGSAADLIKKAMIEIHEALKVQNFKAKMILQIHDELLFESPAEEVAKLGELVKAKMEGALTLKVPLVVDIGAGDDWLTAKE